jgi:hypothetical protein
MARLRYNGLSAVLGGSGLTNSGTTITFAAGLTHSGGTNVPTITGSDYIPLSILDSNGRLAEVVYLTAYTAAATTGTITRGCESTTGVAHSAAVKVAAAPTNRDILGGGILAYKAYNPAVLATYTMTSATVADVDATNLAVTFVAPESGSVMVTLTALSGCSPAAINLAWCLRDGSSTVTGTLGYVRSSSSLTSTTTYSVPVTGLTPGTSYTYKWGHKVDPAGSSGLTYAGGVAGPAVMKVEALP